LPWPVKRFGPVREVEYGLRTGLVLEIAFEGVQRSTRHNPPSIAGHGLPGPDLPLAALQDPFQRLDPVGLGGRPTA
jgi:ATP-dependent DNA ligase